MLHQEGECLHGSGHEPMPQTWTSIRWSLAAPGCGRQAVQFLAIVCGVSAVEHRSHGVPLVDYQLTRHDHGWQRTSERIREAVVREVAREQAEEEADPELRARRGAALERASDILRNSHQPDWQLMRWRVRLYCGHIAETRRHCTLREPTMHGSSSMRCPECGKDPAVIVAYEPLGLLARSPHGDVPCEPRPSKPSRAQLERRVAELEAEVSRLKAEAGPDAGYLGRTGVDR